MGVILRAPGRTWASHRSAAALWGIGSGTPLWPEVSTTADLRGGRATIRCVTFMPPADATKRYGIPVTSAERTLVDLGGSMPARQLESLVVEALRAGVTNLDRLRERADALSSRGRRGSGAIARILLSWGGDEHPESTLEARMLTLIRGHEELPEPRRQWEVRDRGRFVARVDFAYPELRIAIEADGYRWHSDPGRWRSDLARRNELVRAGWLVLHFTWSDVNGRPQHVAETIAAAISRASLPESGIEARKMWRAT